MRVIEWLTSVESSGRGAHNGWMRNHPGALMMGGGGMGVVGLDPLHRLEVFVFLHQLSSQFTIYLPWTVLTFSSFHLWQIPDTLGRASLETSYTIVHTAVSRKGSLHMAPTHRIGLFLYSHINLSSIRQVGRKLWQMQSDLRQVLFPTSGPAHIQRKKQLWECEMKVSFLALASLYLKLSKVW